MQMRMFLQCVSIGAGALLLVNTAYMAVKGNLHAGMAALGAFAVVLLLYGIFFKQLRMLWPHLVLAVVCVCLLAFSAGLAMFGGRDSASFDEDAVIVLGAGIRGEVVGGILARRLDAAVTYYERNQKALIVVSGGQGPQEDITEALAMERYLIAKGVPDAQIIKEERATSTRENFLYSAELLDKLFPEGYKAAFVTSGFHVYRSSRLAASLGLSVGHLGAGIPLHTVPVNYMREMMAVLQVWLFS